MTIHKLSVDFTKCEDCRTCESLLPGFLSMHGGVIRISEKNLQDEDVMAAVARVKDGCPAGAIELQVIE